jgi:hypothetical protein
MAKKKFEIYDAFPTKAGARGAVRSLPSGCAVVRKLKPAQDGGRLKYGVFVKRSCRI